MNKKYIKSLLAYFPIIGIAVFMILYIYATTLYPGGSSFNPQSVGFDWVHNYWCNLMSHEAANGQVNPASPCAKIAMILLCCSLGVFFVIFANRYTKSTFWKSIIKYCGIISMILASMIFTKYHDSMTILSSIFGLMVVIGIIKELYQGDLTVLKWTSIVCIVLLILNNYLYYTSNFIEYLPLLQKISFLIVLLWISALHVQIIKTTRKS